MNKFVNVFLIAGRLLLAMLFVAGAIQKAVAPEGASALLAGFTLPVWLVWPAALFTSVFHFIPDDPWQMSIFVKNWAIAGGLLVLSAHAAERSGR